MSGSGRSKDDGSSFARDASTQTGKAVVLILAAVVFAVVLLNHQPASNTKTSKPAVTTRPTIAAPSTTSSTIALIPPNQIKLLVLNGTLKGVVAGQFTTKLKANPGYLTQTPDDATASVPMSAIYAVSSQYANEAQFLAQTLGLPASSVTVNVPTSSPVPAAEKTVANLILVVGPDLATKA